LPEAASNPKAHQQPRRWTILAAGLLLVALALVVIYTSRSAFFSPITLVVVAAIGLAAILLQLRLRQNVDRRVRAPLWLNVRGIAFATGTVLADVLHVSPGAMLVTALGAVVCFGISGVVVLGALRKHRS
jgi:drug/metabolite transporter (DMT)-like permease